MKCLGIAFLFLAVLSACTVGEDVSSTSTVTTTTSAPTSNPAAQVVDAKTLQTTSQTTSQTASQTASVLTTAVRATTVSLTTTPRPPSPSTTQKTTQGTTTNPPAKATPAATEKSDSPTNTTQVNGTQSAYNESLDASSTKGWSFSSTAFLQNLTSAPGTSDLHVSPTTESTNFSTPRSSSGSKNMPSNDSNYSSIILPVVITLIVITLSVFSLVALYKMCQKKAPERQENGTEQTQSDKEGVKLLSVKTTSPETGEHSSQGKNKTRQLFTHQQ